MDNLYKFLKYFDYFSVPIHLNYRKKDRFQTRLGGFCSFLLIIISIYYSYYLMAQVYLMDDPSINTVLHYKHYPDPIQLYSYQPKDEKNILADSGSLSMSFGISTANNIGLIDINKSYVNLEMSYIEENYYNDTNKQYEVIDLFLCKHLNGLNNEKFESQFLNKSYCFDSNHILEGYPGIRESSYYKITLKECRNNTNSNIVCADPKSIEDYFYEALFEVYYMTDSFNFKIRNDSIERKLAQSHFNLVDGFKKIINFYVSVNTLFSYESFLPSFLSGETKVYKAINVEQEDEEISIFDNDDAILLEIYISSSKSYYFYNRYYKNIINQMALLGGLTYALAISVYIFIYFLIKHRFEENIVNDIYTIIHPKKEKNLEKPFSVFLKERYNKLLEIENTTNNYEYIKSIMVKDEALGKFFNRKRVFNILGINQNLPILGSEKKTMVTNNNYYNSPSTIKDFITNPGENSYDTSSTRKKESLKTNSNIILEDTKSIDDRSVAYSMNFPKLDTLEYYKYRIIYDIFKFQTNDQMFYSILEIFLEIFCPCFAYKKSQKKFKIFRMTLKKLEMDIDILNIIKAVNTFEGLKHLFFDQQQKFLFETILRSCINEEFQKNEEEKFIQNSANLRKALIEDKSKVKLMLEYYDDKSNIDNKENRRNTKLERFKRLQKRHRASLLITEARLKMNYFDRNNKMKIDIQNLVEFEKVIDEIKRKPLSETLRFLFEQIGLEQETIIGFDLELKRRLQMRNLHYEEESKIKELNGTNSHKKLLNLIIDKFGNDMMEEEKDRSFGK